MKSPNYRVKIGIVGCGAIGSRMARTIHRDFKKDCRLVGLYDIKPWKVKELARTLSLKVDPNISLKELIKKSDCMIEAVNAPTTRPIIEASLKAGKTILAMSVGKLLKHPDLFKLARKKKCYILLPSGAIAGVDAIKAASLGKINKITLTTRKPPAGLINNPYLMRRGINLSKIKKETVLYDGGVDKAVKNFPQNINVAATIALASQIRKNKSKIRIRILTSPHYKKNIHEVTVEGDFGRIHTRTENVACPDNPKTSYLAALSGLQTLKQFCTGIVIGT
ncbi:MAG TPA: aspartate dehydrogenase domain-containing protein [Candidatus Omnitrophota bacterium]|nr:aspartate dehydrogenase domain-containing protein [Candidatus Omnitrophota bacterium]